MASECHLLCEGPKCLCLLPEKEEAFQEIKKTRFKWKNKERAQTAMEEVSFLCESLSIWLLDFCCALMCLFVGVTHVTHVHATEHICTTGGRRTTSGSHSFLFY